MPNNFLADYEPVEVRLEKFWKDHPDGSVTTELVDAADGVFIVKATVSEADSIIATGYAREKENDGNVNRTSPLENCETSAIGRALANAGYAAKGKRPSREEMRKTQPVASNGGSSNDDKRALVEQCQAAGLPTNGTVADLKARLAEAPF